MNKTTSRIAVSGVLAALALILSYVESLIAIPFAVPGIKLGLANLVIVFALYRLDYKYAAMIQIVRVALAAFLFSGFSGLIYSLAGAVLSLVVMIILKLNIELSAVTISVCGAITHIIGQMAVAAVVTDIKAIMFYAPYLLAASLITGAIIGIVANILITRIKV